MLPELVSPIPPNREAGPFRVPAEFSVKKIVIDGRVVKSCKQVTSNFLPECVFRAQGLISAYLSRKKAEASESRDLPHPLNPPLICSWIRLQDVSALLHIFPGSFR
jgi:hypothetical protein